MKFILLILVTFSTLFASDFYYELNKKIEIKKQLNKKIENSENTIYEYETISGKIIKFKNEIIVECKQNAYCEDDFIDLTINNYKKIFGEVYLIKIEYHSNFFIKLQELYKKKDIKSATPNYITSMSRR